MALALGIDLGTTNTCAAIYIEDDVEIIKDEQGNSTIPSCVSFKDDKTSIGKQATEKLASNPQNTIYDAKRIIGQKWDEVKLLRWPFAVETENGYPKFKITQNKTTTYIPPELISALVLKKVKKAAAEMIKRDVNDAVITVPAYFNHSQRQATITAGTIAGLNVLEIINEPTAAAIAYGLDNQKDRATNVLVFDLGGGTFDVTILVMTGSNLEVKSSGGDAQLGGIDFDNNMVKHCISVCKTKFQKEIDANNTKAICALRAACELCKKELSQTDISIIDIKSLAEDFDFVYEFSQEKFLELNDSLFTKTIDTVKDVLAEAKLDKDDIHEVLLVGGSTRIPRIQELIRDFFSKAKMVRKVNPDEAVAKGAAIKAAKHFKQTAPSLQGMLISDVTALSLGVEVVGDIMSVIVPRNTQLPTKKTQYYLTAHDKQTGLSFKATISRLYQPAAIPVKQIL